MQKPLISFNDEMVFYAVRKCTAVFPITGATTAWRVMRVHATPTGPQDGPCAALFAHGITGIGKEMAEKYAEYLMRERVEVV